jgi:hypothetical protein
LSFLDKGQNITYFKVFLQKYYIDLLYNMSQPPRVLFNFTEDEIADSAPDKIDSVIDELCESDREDILLDDVEDVKEDRLNLPSIDREQIVQEEIFDVKQKVTEKVKPEKKKRQLSEEHRAKLALAREKALVTRRAKAEEKMKMKAIENETKELKKKKATKELESLKEEVNNDKPLPANPTSKTPSGPQQFTLRDLEQAQLSAIISYEQVRKARKEEKKKQKMIEEQQQKLKSQINNFTKPQGYGARDANGMLINKWHGCY